MRYRPPYARPRSLPLGYYDEDFDFFYHEKHERYKTVTNLHTYFIYDLTAKKRKRQVHLLSTYKDKSGKRRAVIRYEARSRVILEDIEYDQIEKKQGEIHAIII